MAKDATKFRRVISAALDGALSRAYKREQAEGEMVFDLRTARFVIFSDHHRGNRDGADDFRVCERAYNAALAYYDRLQYTLIVTGDVEELWEERPETVLKAYPHTFELEGRFHQAGRYLRLWGNHDDNWSHPDLVKRMLVPALGGKPLKVYESLILHIRDGEEELGRLFLTHGHQGTLDSDRIAPLSKFLVRYFWRPFQRIFKFSANTPSEDFELRYEHEQAMYCWSESQQKLVLIAGHTHRPVFNSESQEDLVRKSLREAEAALAQQADRPGLQQQVAWLAAELEWILAQNQQSAGEVPPMELRKPSYFNAGCCAFLDGDVTGLEFTNGEIRLVRWPDDKGAPKPKVLESAKLEDVFEAC